MAHTPEHEAEQLASGAGSKGSSGIDSDIAGGDGPPVGAEADAPKVLGGYARTMDPASRTLAREALSPSRRQTHTRHGEPLVVRDTQPVYTEGDEWLPAQLTAKEIAAIQADMVRAGLLSEGDFISGVWSHSSAQAYMGVLEEANATRRLPGQVLADTATTRSSRKAKDREARRAAARSKVRQEHALDPDTVRQNVVSGIEAAIGRLPTPDELARFEGTFRGINAESEAAGLAQADAAVEAEFAEEPVEVAPVEQVDVAASFEQELLERYAPTIRANRRMEDFQLGQHNLLNSLGAVSGAISG